MTVPNRLPQRIEADRLTNVARRMAPGSDDGGTAWARPTGQRNRSGAFARAGNIVVVEHGDDGTVERPNAAVVRWVGAATPSNAVVYDDWYPETI